MNDLVYMAKFYLGESFAIDLAEVQRRLAESPMKTLGYRYPREVALDLLSATKESAHKRFCIPWADAHGFIRSPLRGCHAATTDQLRPILITDYRLLTVIGRQPIRRRP